MTRSPSEAGPETPSAPAPAEAPVEVPAVAEVALPATDDAEASVITEVAPSEPPAPEAPKVQLELPEPDYTAMLCAELELPERGVRNTLELKDDGGTVPFIARYRKEATGNLDEVQIRAIFEIHDRQLELFKRKRTVLETIAGQGALDDALRERVLAATTRAEVEDLYLPYKPRRSTRASQAVERGLQPLADQMWGQGDESQSLEEIAAAYVDAEKGVADAAAALAGARDIAAQRIADDARLRAWVRNVTRRDGKLIVRASKRLTKAKSDAESRAEAPRAPEVAPAPEQPSEPAEPATEAPAAEVPEAPPAEVPEATPADATEATPAEVPEATPADATEATPADATEATPADATEVPPEKAEAAEVAAQAAAAAEAKKAAKRDAKKEKKKRKKEEAGRLKYESWVDHREALRSMPSHRYLAIRRGEKEGWLVVGVDVDAEKVTGYLRKQVARREGSPWREQLELAARDAYERLIAPSIESDLRNEVRERAELAAIEVFAQNLRNLLLAAPLGAKAVIGFDPGLRTGTKIAVLDATGKLLEHAHIHTETGAEGREAAKAIVMALCEKHPVGAMAIGNGTGGRETERFIRQLQEDVPQLRGLTRVMVSEAGASVYSASEVAREELPELDLTFRSAVSIGRRLQDPLAELVKIDARSIGVGQYQHDVNQGLLKRKLDEVVESCVNFVGVDLNTASPPLLAQVAGIGPGRAKKIVARRDEKGPYGNRAQLLEVEGLGPRIFEQCAGFLRIPGADNPLDDSAVHPERYGLVERMAADLGLTVTELVAQPERLENIEVGAYIDETAQIGELTVRDILGELGKPGRDPRSEFTGPAFRDDVNEIQDLELGMVLEGAITNVTAFGAFVDVGVHQDGLVHVSELSHRFVGDPTQAVKVGDHVKVKVLSVDVARKRIGLSIKQATPAPERPEGERPRRRRGGRPPERDRDGGRRDGQRREARGDGDRREGGRGGRGRRPDGGRRDDRGGGRRDDRRGGRRDDRRERGGKGGKGRREPFNRIDLSDWLDKQK